jgi:hypothetical protein
MRFALLAAGAAAACGSNSTDPYAPVDCSKVKNVDTYMVGLPKAGDNGMMYFKLMSAEPSPPARNNNTWVVEVDTMVSGAAGTPISGADLVVTPFMPAHNHPSPDMVYVTPVAGTPGQYTLDPVFLWMPGVWTVTIDATQGSAIDSAVYAFCIPN